MPYEVSNGAQEGFLSGVNSADRRSQAQLEDYGRMRNDYFSMMNARMQALSNSDDEDTQNAVNAAYNTGSDMFRAQFNYAPDGSPLFRRNGLNTPQQTPVYNEPIGGVYDSNSPTNRTAYAPNNVQNGTVVATSQYADNARNTLSNIQNLVAAVTNAAQGIRQQQANGQPIHPQAMDNYNKLVNALGYVRNMPNGNSSGRG